MRFTAAVGHRFETMLRPRTGAPCGEVKCILILEYMLPLGNCVHLTPLFEALKTARPHITIVVATRGIALQVLRHSPFVDYLLPTADPLTHLSACARSLAQQLKQHHLNPDCCLTGVPDQRTKIALLAALVCKGWRGGFTRHRLLYHRPFTVDPSLSQIANNLRLAQLFGSTFCTLEPRVFFAEPDIVFAQELLQPDRDSARPILAVVSQNSGGQRTGWHADRWVKTLRHMQHERGHALVYLGTAKEAEAIDSLRGAVGVEGRSLAGATDVNQLAAVLAACDLVISLDTGTMHVARAVGVPMVVLGPSWQKPIEWLPLGRPNIRNLRGEDRMQIPHDYQLDEISAASVIAAAEELSNRYPASEEARQHRLKASLSGVDRQPIS